MAYWSEIVKSCDACNNDKNQSCWTNKINYCKQQDQQGADQKTDNSKEE